MESELQLSPKGTLIGRAVTYDRYFSNILVRSLLFFFWSAAAAALLAISGFIETELLPLANIILGLFLLYLPIRTFYRQKIKYPKPIPLIEAKNRISLGESINLFSLFSFELAKATNKLFRRGKPIESAELIGTLLQSKDMAFILVRLGIGWESLAGILAKDRNPNQLNKILTDALAVALAENHHQIEVGDLFVSLCQNNPSLRQLLVDLKIGIMDVANVVYWQTGLIRRALLGKRFLDASIFRLSGGIGRDWAYGFTPILQRYGHDLTETVRSYGLGLEVIGREREISEIEEALLRQNGGNAILVGEAGVGKRTTLLGLAKKIAEGESVPQLTFFHLVELDIESLLAGYRNEGEASERLDQLFIEIIHAGNIIAFIPNLENLLGATGTGSIDASDILIRYLNSPALRIIGSIDTVGYNKYIRSRTALVERMTRVSISESDQAETIRILEDSVPLIESRVKTIISYEAIKEAVVLGNRYLQDTPNPERSINILDGAAAQAAKGRGNTILLPKDISDYLTAKYDLPSKEANQDESKKLLALEGEMKKSIIGQSEAVAAICGALKRARAGITNSKKPIGSFLFLGPTGVGKTETAKVLARVYFGQESRLIRFDMSEYQNPEDIYRLIGSNRSGLEDQGLLTMAVREHPFSLFLFDEIEKADPHILDLFLQIFDEGFLTDGTGRKVIFSNTLIICTSNAGANIIRESIKGGKLYDQSKKVLIDFLQQENIYRPEFLNRFTQVVVFSPLSEEDIVQVAQLMTTKIKADILANKGIHLQFTPEVFPALAKIGFDPKMGARPMARAIEEKIENILAEKILTRALKEGDSYEIGLAEIK